MQNDIFLLCRDFARVYKGDAKYFTFSRQEDVLAKLIKKRRETSIIVTGFYFANSKFLLPDFAKKVKEINSNNIVIGVTKSTTECNLCDAIFHPDQVSVEMGEDNYNLLKNSGFEPSFYPVTRFFSGKIGGMSKKNIVEELNSSLNWGDILSWTEKHAKKRT